MRYSKFDEIAECVLELLEKHMEQNYRGSIHLRGDQILDTVNKRLPYVVTVRKLSSVMYWLIDHDFVRVTSLRLNFGGELPVYRLNDDQEAVHKRHFAHCDLMGRVMAHAFVGAMQEVTDHDKQEPLHQR